MERKIFNPRRPEYLSPTALSKWMDNPREYYLTYMTPTKPPRLPQLQVMSVGSAFDAEVKALLARNVWGPNFDSKFDRDALFISQVEPQNRDWASEAGKWCMKAYQDSGAFDRLVNDVLKADSDPIMEIKRFGKAIGPDNVPLFGIADLAYPIKGVWKVRDWKVNGYCSAASPVAGYRMILKGTAMAAGKHGEPHKDYIPAWLGDIEHSIDAYLQVKKSDWARQISTYAWLEGIPVGEPFVAGIDQLACDSKQSVQVQIRCVEHACLITPDFQELVYERYRTLWNIVQSDHIFRDLTPEESLEQCYKYDRAAEDMNSEDKNERWLANLNRR